MQGKLIKFSVIGLFFGLIILNLTIRYCCLRHEELYPTTHKAVLKSTITQVTAPLSGTVGIIYIQNGALVKNGDLIYQVDPTTYQTAFDEAKQRLSNIKQEVSDLEAAVNKAENLINQRQTALSQITKENFQQGIATSQEASTPNAKAAEAALEAAVKQHELALQRFGKPGTAAAKIKAAEANLKTAEANLRLSRVTAPADGFIYHLNLRQGSKVTLKKVVFEIIDNKEWWVDANFKPKQLPHIAVGQPAIIVVGKQRLAGTVEAITESSVRIKVVNPDATFLGDIGTAVTVIVNTATETAKSS